MERDKPTYIDKPTHTFITEASEKGKSELLKSLILKNIEENATDQPWIILGRLSPDKAKAIVELLFEDESEVLFGKLSPEDARTMAGAMFEEKLEVGEAKKKIAQTS